VDEAGEAVGRRNWLWKGDRPAIGRKAPRGGIALYPDWPAPAWITQFFASARTRYL